MNKGTLYIVATPIGNLSDVTCRMTETLESVDLIACEDTRVTQKLLNHIGVNKKTISYHKFSESERSEKLIEILLNGQNVALVTDAGTPLISDPGSIIVEKARDNGVKVVPIPGCNAVITALSAIKNDGVFSFCGFFPQKVSEIEKYKKHIGEFNLVFYESPNRIIKTLYEIREQFGEITVSIARELTKIHEDINTFLVSDMINYLENSIVKGEIVLILHKFQQKEQVQYMEHIQKLLKKGYSSKDVAQILSTLFDIPKNEIYNQIINI